MKLQSGAIAIIVTGAFIVGIGISMLTGWWRTEGTRIPVKFTSGEHAGDYNPADIRGSYTFQDISDAFDVPVAELARAFGITSLENPAAFQLKELEEMYEATAAGEVGTDAARYFVALYTGLPYEPEDTTLLPSPAVSVLSDRVSEEVLAVLRGRTLSLSTVRGGDAVETEEHTTEVGVVKGKTTFGELMDWGLSEEQVKKALGFPIGRNGESVRDACVSNNVEFKDVKEALQALLDDLS